MRASRKIAPLFLVVAWSMAACGGDPPPPPPPLHSELPAPASPVASDRKLPGRPAVEAALLTPEELGAGYSTAPGLAANNPAYGLNTSLTDCAEAPADTGAVKAQQVHQVGPVGPFLVETITATQVPAATTLMNRLRDVKKNCHQFDGKMAGGIELQITIDDLTVARVGEETVAYRLTATIPGVAGAGFYAHLVTARAGGVVVLVSLLQMTSPDVAATEKIVRAAMAKAQKTLG